MYASCGAHDIIDPKQEAYIHNNLYKIPTGSFFGTIMREIQEAQVEQKFAKYCESVGRLPLEKRTTQPGADGGFAPKDRFGAWWRRSKNAKDRPAAG